MATTIYGRIAFGNQQELPLEGFPSGRAKIKIRQDDFVRVYIKSDESIREFVVEEKDGKWVPAFQTQSNSRH